MDNPTFHTLATLKQRGWTNSLVTRFLGSPDQLRTNPHFRSGAPMRLYSILRVEAVEQRDDFKAAVQLSQGRSEVGRKVAAEKRDELLAEIARMEVIVEVVPSERLFTEAIIAYNDRRRAREMLYGEARNGGPAFEGSDPLFLQRIAVNYIRHSLTRYDAALEGTARRVGRGDAIAEIRRRVYAAIKLAYPYLAAEVDRQTAVRDAGEGAC